MSRIGKVPITVPQGVQVSVTPEMVVSVKGPKGQLEVNTRNHVDVKIEDSQISVSRRSDAAQDRAFHGLYHRLITNAILGVTEGFKKELDIHGVGYRAEKRGADLVLNVGFSHEVLYKVAPTVQVNLTDPTTVVIEGADKELVARTAAEIRLVNPPEPYKGKGIRYKGEIVRRKVGKAGAK